MTRGAVADQIAELRAALFDESLSGIRRTGEVWPLGAFLLAGGMIDTLAGLRFAPADDFDGKQGERYAAFVHEYFPARYMQLEMGSKLWRGLRCRPLHNFSAQGIILADSQRGDNIHLRPASDGRGILLHWTEFLADYTEAIGRYWTALEGDEQLRANAERRCERYPPMMVIEVQIPATLPFTLPFTLGAQGATGYGGPT
jgi:hypothetical protein